MRIRSTISQGSVTAAGSDALRGRANPALAQPMARAVTLALALTLPITALPSALAAQPVGLAVRKISPPGGATTDVAFEIFEPRFSPDGRWIAFWSDADTDEVFDLYVASRFGGAPRRVSPLRPPGSLGVLFTAFGISADSRHVAFTSDVLAPGSLDLWSVPIDGTAGDVVMLNDAVPEAQSMDGFSVADGGESILFRSLVPGGGKELWSAPFDGSLPAVRLHGALPPGATGSDAYLDSAGDRTVFISDLEVAGRHELWSAPTDGSAPAIRLSGTMIPSGDVTKFQLTPDGEHVIYHASQRFVGVTELWSVPIAGPFTAVERLSPTLPAFGDVHIRLVFGTGSSRMLFRADTTNDEQLELWSVPILGPASSAVQLNEPLVPGGSIYEFSILGDDVVYIADGDVDERYEAFIVPAEGPAAASVPLHGALPAGGDVALAGAVPTSPEPLVILGGDLRVDQEYDLFVQALDGAGAPSPLFGEVPGNAGFQPGCGAAFSPDISAIYVCADLLVAGRIELWKLVLAPGSTPQLRSAADPVAGGDVTRLLLSADGRWLFYRADESVDQRFDLFRVAAGGSTPPARVHAVPAVAGGDVAETESFWIAPDGHGVVFAADHDTDEKIELWISDAAIFFDDFELGEAAGWSSMTP